MPASPSRPDGNNLRVPDQPKGPGGTLVRATIGISAPFRVRGFVLRQASSLRHAV